MIESKFKPYLGTDCKRFKKSKFNRAKLPEPALILTKLGKTPTKCNHQGYLVLCCPFHKSGKEENPSLNLHSVTGHYKCHSCGEKGSSILDFYMKVTGKPFKDAAKDLGAWEGRDE